MAEAAIRPAAMDDEAIREKSPVSNKFTKPRAKAGVSKTSLKELDKRFSDMELKFDSGFEKILQYLESVKSATQ
jgi:hypothetical protein